ncbi:RNA polymerase factor sigma-54 [Chitinasiproducens palmae]
MQQSVRLLQLSALDFTQEVNAALTTNPFLEYEEAAANGDTDAPTGVDAAPSAEGVTTSEAPSSALESDAPVETVSEAAPADLPSEYIGEGGGRAGGDGEGGDPCDWMHAEPDLRDRLHQSLSLSPLGERDRFAAQVVIESLEEDGYLRQPLEELIGVGDCEPPLSEDELRVAVRLVQTLDAPGIGARSLSECLMLQLEAMDDDTPCRDIAIEIASHHLPRLAKREHAELQRALGCDPEALRTACALIRRLDPKPGHNYSVDANNYVVPDVIVRQVKGKWVVSINPAVMPKARVNRMYVDMFAQSDASSRSPLAQQLQEARWLMRNVQQRFATIQRVAETIVSHQRAFFDYGEVALRPLVLRDVAQELGLHESTVSRATGNKYMATPRGIFEFKHFFPRELSTDSGGTCSAAAVRALLKEMISAESSDAPLSDVALAKMLADQGVIVARRTVAKYRRLMKVPPAELRRI